MRPVDGRGPRVLVALVAAVVFALVVVAAGSGLLLDAGSAHAAVGRATDRCDELIALSDDLTTLDTSQKFDADGMYVRRWVPELRDLPDKHLAEPWEAPEEVLEEAGVSLGKDYPEPLVDLRRSREEAIARFGDQRG